MSIRRGAEPMGEWGRRASRLYGEDYATRYSDTDRGAGADVAFVQLSTWLGDLCSRFDRPMAALDLGCGTGRYFAALSNLRELVGIDASDAMLERARTAAAPIAARTPVTLIQGDFETCRFEPGRFDLVYAVGVLAEHVPLTGALANRVFTWLAPGGAFAFTAVHPESFSIAQSWKRRLGRRAMAFVPGSLSEWLRMRWLADGMYADEPRVAGVLTDAGFTMESLDRLLDVHLHCLAVGRKPLSR